MKMQALNCVLMYAHKLIMFILLLVSDLENLLVFCKIITLTAEKMIRTL